MGTPNETTPCLPDNPLEACKKLREAHGIGDVRDCKKDCPQVSACPNAAWCQYMESSTKQSDAALEQAAELERQMTMYEHGHDFE